MTYVLGVVVAAAWAGVAYLGFKLDRESTTR